jgi:hypothetical protein
MFQTNMSLPSSVLKQETSNKLGGSQDGLHLILEDEGDMSPEK